MVVRSRSCGKAVPCCMAPAQVAQTQLEELPIETRSVKALQLQQLKRSFDLFAGNYGSKPDLDSGRSATIHPYVRKLDRSSLPVCADGMLRVVSICSQEAKLRCKVGQTAFSSDILQHSHIFAWIYAVILSARKVSNCSADTGRV